jgi:N-acetylated-alpha-linked acidic dipeptidase
MHSLRHAAVVFFWLSGLAAAAGADQPAARADAEREARFLATPSPENMREYMRRLSARPHHLGSAYDKDNAEWILARFREWGLEARIETFDVLFPTPKQRLVEMVEPTRFRAKLEEPPLAVDPTSAQRAEQLPTYNAYSIDGDVTGPLVYVNYGLPEDYERLERLGVSVKGAIVLARYGHSWRGIKPKVAAEHGALGCLIYSDPRDDGYFLDDVFPQGPMRPRDGAQRGSVMDFPSSNPGDPLTPGVGATAEAKRLPLAEAKSITKIPVLPLSYGDAQPLLAALRGPVAPEEGRGALPVAYHVGPGPAKVHLKVAASWDLKTVYDVVARVPGAERPDEWIVRGNHHDAWVNGAEDPVSGLVALLEEARSIGILLKEGWRPKRTIVYCAWDGEEPMLLGSTEWAEAHADELGRHAVAYINTDGNGRGFLSMSGSHTLEAFVNGVARDVLDPEAKLSVWKRLRARSLRSARTAEERKEIRERPDLRMGALGSGSDYTAFIDHLGVASLDLAYGGEDEGGIYHSIYDDFYWFTHFSDTDFVYGRALAQTVGLAVLRLADAELLPFDFGGLADTMKTYSKELKTLLEDKQSEIRERNRQIDEGVFAATRDPRRPTVAPPREDMAPHLNFAPLENAVEALGRSAQRYAKAREGLRGRDGLPSDSLARVNALLIRSERLLTSPDGLPRRPWFKHLIYAPGVYAGYDAKTLPGAREAIEQKRYAEADGEIARVAKALQDEAALVEEAAGELEAIVR